MAAVARGLEPVKLPAALVRLSTEVAARAHRASSSSRIRRPSLFSAASSALSGAAV
jgi:hypothetical protein